MITTNLKNLMKLIYISSSSTPPGSAEAITLDGQTKYLGPIFSSSFPSYVAQVFNTSLTAAGIKVGTGTATPTENDHALTSQITSGLSATIVTTRTLDSDNNPCLIFIMTLSNTTASDITIAEVGYAATMAASNTIGASANNTYNFLIDHTLLDSPLTVPANGNAVLRYELKVEL